ncbi:MAG: carbohydrate kinase family protein [Spirochaetaceae bacterium]|jgi:sugar/nucleoside kinase (ribokinase family)|nr:carbohydrate kinase family protein [Spirochaetaceae bacterium]
MMRIHGTGCCLMDYLYPRTNFGSPQFRSWLSKKDGDGGLAIGKLVFAKDFEAFAGMPYENALAKITTGEPACNLGGPAAVSMVHAAQVLGKAARVCLYGARGNDPAGDMVEGALARAGFFPRAPETPAEETAGPGQYVLKRYGGFTPRTDVLSDPAYDNGHGERTFINLIGDAEHFGPEDLGKDFFCADIVVFGGTALTPRIHRNLTELLSTAKQKNASTVVNLVYDYRGEQSAPGEKWKLGSHDDAYPFIDVLIADKAEAWRTSSRPSTDEAARWFIERGCAAVIITEGAKPLYLAAGGRGIFKALAGARVPVSGAISRELAAHPEKRGDTTGCGDNFAGGVIAGLAESLERGPQAPALEKLDLRDICIPGIIAGGYACFTLGGVFYEKYPGEKRQRLAPFIEAYKTETRKGR